MKWAAWAVRAAANAALLAGEGKDVALARTGRGGGGRQQRTGKRAGHRGDGRWEEGREEEEPFPRMQWGKLG